MQKFSQKGAKREDRDQICHVIQEFCHVDFGSEMVNQLKGDFDRDAT